jgi:hypothetical protein
MVNTFLFGSVMGNPLAESGFMRRDEVKTIFSVYQIWLQEARGAAANIGHGDSRVAQNVHRQVKSFPHRKPAQELSSQSQRSSLITS